MKKLLFFPYSFYIAILIRAVLLFYGEWQDAHLSVPFTDIDYYVLNDGAYCILHPCNSSLTKFPLHEKGLSGSSEFLPAEDPLMRNQSGPTQSHLPYHGSPYDRETYRYTPLLSYILLLNHWIGWKLIGKLVFICFDLVAGYLLILFSKRYDKVRIANAPTSFSTSSRTYAHALSSSFKQSSSSKAYQLNNHSNESRDVHSLETNTSSSNSHELFTTFFWLWNPLVFTISSRGNAESIVCTFILAFLYFFSQKKFTLAAILYGFSVHLKIFPIIYIIPLYFWFAQNDHSSSDIKIQSQSDDKSSAPMKMNPNLQSSSFSSFYPFYSNFLRPPMLPLPFLKFGLVSGSLFFSLLGLFYYLYGFTFLYETYLYHIIRKDHRHNFSPFFYPIYLLSDPSWRDGFCNCLLKGLFNLACIVPQFFPLIYLGRKLSSDFPFACFILTVTFVTFNKVITSQYFLWYISFLPIVCPSLKIGPVKALLMIMLWFASQGVWLHFAYQLEFLGLNTFLKIWCASIGFFFTNVYLIKELTNAHAMMRSS